MHDNQIHDVIQILRRVTRDLPVPYVTRLAHETHDPFLILIATILSLRTKDIPTETASERLFELARTPEAMVKIPWEKIANTIAPVLYPAVKARNIVKICEILIGQYDGHVPGNLDQLDELPGVGRKTANLVITLGFDELGICVDTHVHRITNRWGYVKTKTPDETELALRAKLPHEYWIEINSELVAFGQNICVAVSPKCSTCPLLSYCDRVGVKTSR
jgi:endonuclease III